MSDARGWQPLPAPRAIAELPLGASLARTHEIAGAWALALLRSRPLEQAGLLPLGELARGAPELCAQLIAAVHSDAGLERVRAGERVLELTGARDPAEAVRALELLRGILSGALEPDLPDASARQAVDLRERVAFVCATLLEAAVGGRDRPPAGATRGDSAGEHGPLPAREPAPAPERGGQAAHGAFPSGGALIVDELEGSGASVAAAPALTATELAPREATIEIRDERGESPPVPWIAAIARQLERYEADRLPFAVLLVELRELERLRLGTAPAELAALGASLERVLAGRLSLAGAGAQPGGGGAPSWTGSLTAQGPGRCWLLVPQTDRLAAHALADRVERAVATALFHGGRALEVLVGIAVCPQDGRQAAALAAHADIDLHAARASRR